MNPLKKYIYNTHQNKPFYEKRRIKQPFVMLFLVICFIHFLEHIIQLYQLYILHLPRPECMGLVGYIFPDLMRSEWLHFGFAVYMLFGLYILKLYFGITPLILQALHTFEHLTLVSQKTTNLFLMSPDKVISMGEIWFPKIELHLFYTTVVMVAMMIGFKSRFRK